MARTKLTARKATGGRGVPRHRLATKLTRKTFLSYFGLPTILWRILQAVGYEEGQEPRYSWQKEIYGQDSLVMVEIKVKALPAKPHWTGWTEITRGTCAKDGANRAAYLVLKDIIARFPADLASAMAGVFPRGSLFPLRWKQTSESVLTGSPEERFYCETPAMSATGALLGVCESLERTLESVSFTLTATYQSKRKLQEEFDAEVARLQERVQQVTLERDDARTTAAAQATARTVAEQMYLTTALQRDEARTTLDQLREGAHLLIQ